MVKKILLAISVAVLLTLPAHSAQELDGNSDGKIDNSLYDAYDNLDNASKIGTGAAQVSAGDHTHSTMVAGPGASSNGELAVFSGTGGYTIKASGLGAGIVKVSAAAVPSIATAGTDYIATETDPIVGAVDGLVKSDGSANFSAATRSDYAVAGIIGTYASPTDISSGYSLDAANAYGFILTTTGAGTVSLPAGVAGMNGIIRSNSNNIVTVDPNGSEVVVRDGTTQTGGVSFTLSAGVGNYVAIYYDGAGWVTLGYKGTLAAGS